MALINCRECNHKISDASKSCVNCGHPTDIIDNKLESFGNSLSDIGDSLTIISFVLLIILFLMFC